MIASGEDAAGARELLEIAVTGLFDDGLRRPGRTGPGIATAIGSELHRLHQAAELDCDPRARAEVPLDAELWVDGCRVRLRGRADLVRERDDHWLVEELKSFFGETPRAVGPATLQLRTYAWMLARTEALPDELQPDVV